MIDGSVLQSAQRCLEKKSRVVVKMVVTDGERDSLEMMRNNIYKETIQEVEKLFFDCFQDVKEEVEDFILALQHRDIPRNLSSHPKSARIQCHL